MTVKGFQMDVIKKLQQAGNTNSVLTIVYHGGSQPGTKRRIQPIKITPEEIRAAELSTGQVKRFKVSKIEIVSDDHSAKEYIPGAKLEPEYTNLIESLEKKVPTMEALGWHVRLCKSQVSVHRYFKNGKPRKGADAGILFSGDSGVRPWYVWGPDLPSARTFSNLGNAVRLFLKQANSHAPKNVT